jgi:hypothetical protein
MTKALSFSDVARQNEHDNIWVLNTTQGERRGNVFFTVPNQTGTREDQVTVFASFAPACLTDQVTRKQLLDSSSFRRSVNLGMLKLISEDDAQALLEEPGAREEAERVRNLSVGTATSEAQYGLGKDAPVAEVANKLDGISVPVQQYVDLLDTIQDAEALNSLRNMGQLKIEEYRFIKKATEKLRLEATGKYCVAEIAKLKNS